EMWEGWGKNTVLSFRENPAAGFLAVLGVFSAAAMPALLFAWARRSWREASRSRRVGDRIAAGWVAGLAAYSIGAQLLFRRRVDKLLGLPPGWALTQPVGAAIFGLIMLYSAVRLATGRGVTWKGRTYAARRNFPT